MAQVGKLT